MPALRRRASRYHRGENLTPWQRWCVIRGNASGFASEADLLAAYDTLRDHLIETLDVAADFPAFWAMEEVPDDLRQPLHRYGHVRLDEPDRTVYRVSYENLIDARRAWLAQEGFR